MDPNVNSVIRHSCTVLPMGTKIPTEGPRGGKTTVTKSGLIRSVVYFHADERKALRMAAAEQDVSVSDLVRRAVRAYLGVED